MVGVAHIWVCTRKEQTMAISVPVPKDLSGIKTKVALNLTKRQIICFSGAAITGVPLYFLTKGVLGSPYHGGSDAAIFLFGNVRKGRVSGRKTSVLYDTAEDAYTGDTSL